MLGDNWDSNRDEDWIGVDLEQGEEYTGRLRTKTSLPERLQATELKILGVHDSNGNAITGIASAGAAGRTVFVTDWEAPARAVTTSPLGQRVPTAPAPTGSASPGRSRTNRSPRPGHPRQARTRHTEWAFQPSYSTVDAL